MLLPNVELLARAPAPLLSSLPKIRFDNWHIKSQTTAIQVVQRVIELITGSDIGGIPPIGQNQPTN